MEVNKSFGKSLFDSWGGGGGGESGNIGITSLCMFIIQYRFCHFI